MPVSVIVGGQFGSEGKGKVAYEIARRHATGVAVRVGGPNSGHTVVVDGKRQVLRTLPTAAFVEGHIAVIPAGAYLRPDVLREEIDRTGLSPARLAIDPDAWIVTDEHVATERAWGNESPIGSTCSGTGAAVSHRVRRSGRGLTAGGVPELREYVRPTVPLMRAALERGERVVIEGTQGAGLSLLHGGQYPYATSRDTNASGFLSEAGLSPLDVDEVVLVIRAFPIRVAGNSGPLPNEITWGAVSLRAASLRDTAEYTTVTKKLRRVAEFDAAVVRTAVAINRPTCVVLNHVDYVDGVRGRDKLTPEQEEFVLRVEREVEVHVRYAGTSPHTQVDRTRPRVP